MTNGLNGQNTVTYAALAVILLIVLASSFYSFSQLNALSAKVDAVQSQSQSNYGNAAAINALATRVQNLEAQFQQSNVTAKLILFYDSSCRFCGNSFMLNNLEQTRQVLSNFSIGLQAIDIKNNPNAALAVGVNNVPVFFAGVADLSANRKLVDFMNALPKIQFSLQESTNGLTAFPPVSAKVVSNLSCAVPNAVQLEEFYSPTCAYCRPVQYANGTRYNNASNNAGFSVLSGDTAQAISQQFGAKLNLIQRCIGVHTLDENNQVLNLTASDDTLCSQLDGNATFAANTAISNQYGISGTPTFVIDCQYITKDRDQTKLQHDLCTLRPELCASLPTPTLPPEIAKAFNVTPANSSK